jgi:2-C-methyl-D-erythritol 4-phosphate cytidylyltransferase
MTRQESVLNGLEKINPKAKFVAIADGARCLTNEDQITAVCRAAYKYKAATAAHRSTDTVKIADSKGFIESTADRSTVWLAQTPQVFKTSLYRAAAYTALKKGFEATDDNSLVEFIKHPVRLVECGAQNIKITTREDLPVAEAILLERKRYEEEGY